MAKTVVHQLSLVGIGGIQQSFVPYFKKARKESSFNHQIFGMHELDESYLDVFGFYKNLKKDFFTKIRFAYYLASNNYIIHFYNNLGSSSVKKLLLICPSSNIVFHERGAAWNAKDKDIITYRSNASKAKLILANSNATKWMLINRFKIPENKIRVVYNGFLDSDFTYPPNGMQTERFSEKFCVGYIGRLETPKGVHVFIEAAKKLLNYNFYIAGVGSWEESLKKQAEGFDNIFFLGRVNEPLDFISKMDTIVVPSIREPLGNTVIEAAYCKKVVVASSIDGIPEIIKNRKSGVLLEPKNNLSFDTVPYDAVPIPQSVVNPRTYELQKPKEIDVNELCLIIDELASDIDLRVSLSEELYKSVTKTFTINNYFSEVEGFYKDIFDGQVF